MSLGCSGAVDPMLTSLARDIVKLASVLEHAYCSAPDGQARAALRVLSRAHEILQQQEPAADVATHGDSAHGLFADAVSACADAPRNPAPLDDSDGQLTAAVELSVDTSPLVVSSRAGEHGELRLLVHAGDEQRARWIAGGPHGWLACGRAGGARYIGAGNAQGSLEALAEARSNTLV